jgi:transcriptional regulator with XRE-family HTH domain
MPTLGGLIKDYRIQKRILQLDIATKVGWSDASRLSKIEQGRTHKPSRAVVDKILAVLGLSESEKNEVLLSGGYLPTDKETKKAIKEVAGKLISWIYPSYVTDFTWRLVASNEPASKTFYVPPKINLIKANVNLLEFPFLPESALPLEIFKGEDEKSIEQFPVAQVAQFKIEQHMRTGEAWYRKLIARLMKNEMFREYWVKITPNSYRKKVLDYEYKVIKGSWTGKKQTLRFHILSSKLISDPRFQIMLYLPVDKETKDFYAKKLYLKVKT